MSEREVFIGDQIVTLSDVLMCPSFSHARPAKEHELSAESAL